MNIIKNKFIFLGFSGLMVLASLITIFTKDINFSIEFTGGSLMEVAYTETPDIDQVHQNVADAGFDDAQVQPFGENGILVRTRDLTEPERQQLLQSLTLTGTTPKETLVPEEQRFNSIGPSVGRELRTKSLVALVVVAIAIVLFVAFAFRKVSKPVSSWKYGLIAVIALLHDVIIPIGVFVLLGREVGTLFVVGLLSILGLSVNDTIVVFDRIRENLVNNMRNKLRQSFDAIVGTSIKQTITRSINTSFTLIVVLMALFLVGPDSTQDLALVLLVGTVLGTYSSIFVASPLLVVMSKNLSTEDSSE